MNRMIRFLIVALSFLSAAGASAALFGTIDSVDTLKVIAEQKAEKSDRMPAGQVSNPTDGTTSTDGAIDSPSGKDSEKPTTTEKTSN